jgi:hypothetical protein
MAVPLIGSFIEGPIWDPSLSRHRSVANYFAVELVVLKEMTQELAELFGLALPENFRR